MSTEEENLEEPSNTTLDAATEGASEQLEEGQEQQEPKRKLELEVEISETGPCRKHLKVAISRTDVEHQFDESLRELRREAQVPGFRPGRAPRGLVQRRFRKEMADQVKSALLVACMEQLDEDYKLNPISQPNLDVGAIELPEDGPMTFEMDIEVQPEFQLPDYKSLKVKRPVKTIDDADIDAYLKTFLERYAQMVPRLDEPAEMGDFVTASLTFHYGGVMTNEVKEVQLRVMPELQFRDGRIPKLSEALLGARPGDRREAEAEIGESSPDAALRGKTVQVVFQILDLKRLRLPELDAAFLNRLGFDNIEELRDVVRSALERRFAFQQKQALRRSIVDQLIAQTPFDLPPDLVARQERATLQRQVQEMQRGGMSENEIRAREAQIRANAHRETLRSLKESFILGRIAEAEEVKVEDQDITREIEAMALQADESPRRVRARIEKDGLTESLAIQILERKVIDRILEYAAVEDVPLVEERPVETIEQTAAAPGAEETAEAGAEAAAEGQAQAESGAQQQAAAEGELAEPEGTPPA